MLPPEILEMIFSLLPIKDLLNTARSCKLFHQVVSRPTFLYHKKRYFRYRLSGSDEIRQELESELDSDLGPIDRTPEEEQYSEDYLRRSQIASPDTVYRLHRFIEWGLIRLSQEFGDNDKQRKEASLRLRRLKQHPKFELAETLLKIKYSDSKIFAANPAVNDNYELIDHRCVAFVICVIASDISEVRQLLRLASSPAGHCSVAEVSDLFYQILTYLLFFERKFRSPSKLHYQLYYALFMWENENCRIEKSDRVVSLTAEQNRVVLQNIDVSDPRCVKIVAFAGTGKTTTLIELCKKNPSIRFLLVVFNKVVAELSAKSFPKNVVARTAHSMAYSCMIKRFGEKEWKRRSCWGELKADQYVKSDLMKARGKGAGNIYKRAAQLAQTIRTFCQSVELELELEHVPSMWPLEHGQSGQMELISNEHRLALLEDAQNVWEKGVLNSHSSFKIDPTAYLKLFQLDKPDLRQYENFDVLLIDEAQDMNLPMLKICLDQKAPKFIVGDPHQQIYAFNGAVNGMEQVNVLSEVKATYHLTQSFRFGFEIAYAASMVINLLKGEESLALVGNANVIDSINGSLPPGVSESGKTVILTRTNLCLFEQMVEEVCKKDERPKIGLDIQMANFFDILTDICYLYTGQRSRIENYGIKLFSTFPELVQRIMVTNDAELGMKVKIVEKYGEKLIEYIDIIRSCAQAYDHPEVKLIFSTVHKFKGLECETVKLASDFYVEFPVNSKPRINKLNFEECNLLYVALTRAKRRLIMNRQLYHLLHGPAMDTFQKIRIPSSIPAHKIVCVFCAENCKSHDENYPAAVWQDAVIVFPDRLFPRGPVCRTCQTIPFRRIPLTKNGFQMSNSLVYPWTINSWGVVMSGILQIPNPFKEFASRITPISIDMKEILIDSDDEFDEMVLFLKQDLFDKH